MDVFNEGHDNLVPLWPHVKLRWQSVELRSKPSNEVIVPRQGAPLMPHLAPPQQQQMRRRAVLSVELPSVRSGRLGEET
jgi:hypothetical protein